MNLRIFLLSVVLLIPLLVWIDATDALNVSSFKTAPPGQGLYVAAKLAGLYAGLLATLQVVYGLLGPWLASTRNFSWNPRLHRNLGIVVCSMIILHAVLFASAKAVRLDQIPWQLLFLEFDQGYYRGAVSIGALGFYGVLIVMWAGLLRKIFPSGWKKVHKIAPYAVFLGVLHALLIGSEAKTPILTLFYGSLTLLIAAVLIIRVGMRIAGGTRQG